MATDFSKYGIVENEDGTISFTNTNGGTIRAARNMLRPETLQAIQSAKDTKREGLGQSVKEFFGGKTRQDELFDQAAQDTGQGSAPMQNVGPYAIPASMPNAQPTQDNALAEEAAFTQSQAQPASLTVEQPQPAPSSPQMPFMATTTQAQTTTSGMAPKERAEVDRAYGKAMQLADDAVIARALADEKELEVQTGRAMALADERQRLDAQMEESRQERLNALKGAESEVKAAQDAVDQFQFKDFWAEKSTGDRLLAAIATGMGAFGAGMTGGPNYAMNIIKDTIDRDLDVQKSRLGKAQAGVQARRSVLGDLRARLKDEEAADLAFYDASLKKVEDKFLGMAATAKSADLKAKAQEMAAKLQEERAKVQGSLATKVQTTVTAESKPVIPQGGFKSPEELIKTADGDALIKAAREARTASDQFRTLREAGADGAAVADYIANGLKQGSFGSDFVRMLEKKNLWEQGTGFLRERFVGGYNPKMLDEIQSAAENGARNLAARAAPRAQYYDGEASRMGLPPGFILGAPTAREKDNEQAARAGLQRVGMKK